MTIETKSIFSSKVFWIAVVQAIAGAVAVFSTSYPTVGWLVMAKSIVDVILRFGTQMPVSLAGGTKEV